MPTDPKPDTHEVEERLHAYAALIPCPSCDDCVEGPCTCLDDPYKGDLGAVRRDLRSVLTALSEERKRAEGYKAAALALKVACGDSIRESIKIADWYFDERQKRQEAQARAERYRAAALALKKACGKAVRDSDEIAESYQDLGRVWDEAERELADVQQKLRTVEKALKQATNRPWDER